MCLYVSSYNLLTQINFPKCKCGACYPCTFHATSTISDLKLSDPDFKFVGSLLCPERFFSVLSGFTLSPKRKI